MKRILAAFLLTMAFGAAIAPGDEIETWIETLGAESFQARGKAGDAILNRSRDETEKVAARLLQHMRTNLDPEIRFQSGDILKRIFELVVLGKGTSEFGIKLGWFVEDDGKTIVTQPMVLEVIEGGPAGKSGLRKGDVITAIDGKSCRDIDGKQKLMRVLVSASPGKIVTFQVMSNLQLTDPFKFSYRSEKRELKVTPEVYQPSAESEPFPAERFRNWLEALPTEAP